MLRLSILCVLFMFSGSLIAQTKVTCNSISTYTWNTEGDGWKLESTLNDVSCIFLFEDETPGYDLEYNTVQVFDYSVEGAYPNISTYGVYAIETLEDGRKLIDLDMIDSLDVFRITWNEKDQTLSFMQNGVDRLTEYKIESIEVTE